MATTNLPGAEATAAYPKAANELDATTQESLPSVAILAGSSNGRLISSGITIAGDRERGGFNVEVARAAAREAFEKEISTNTLSSSEHRQATVGRVQKGFRSSNQYRRNLGEGGRVLQRDGGAPSWGWNQDKHARPAGKPLGRPPGWMSAARSHRHQTNITAGSDGFVGNSVGHKYGGGSFPAPSCGGASCESVASGVGGTSFVGTEGSSGKSALAGSVAVRGGVQNVQGLSADSVRWWSSRGPSRSSSRPYRSQGGGRGGQGETIRTLVHMGLL